MTNWDRGARPTAHDWVMPARLRGGRSLLLALLLALALVFATTTAAAAVASPLKPRTTAAMPGYNQAAINRALAALAKAKTAVNKQLHPKKKHHRHRNS